MGYIQGAEILKTTAFDKWFLKLKDRQAKARINISLRRCQLHGYMVGDLKPVGDEVFEMRLHFGPGYRIYYCLWGDAVVLLLIGGDKSSQHDDIRKAKDLAAHTRKDQS